ncbi:MAG: oxygenase MpaB family protein [Parvularculaceae bacterium]|nr:oxygenase MpaB family protein [Parvularculaceae bacterium]
MPELRAQQWGALCVWRECDRPEIFNARLAPFTILKPYFGAIVWQTGVMSILGVRERIRAPIREALDNAATAFLAGEGEPRIDFSKPQGEAALTDPDSVSWRIFKNPVALFVGGITAVILELAEPRIRTGVWEHTTFRTNPIARLRRTGLAAMVTVYGARSVSETMIAGVGRMHARVGGVTPSGEPYRANDPELMNWVHATASFGFMEAYHAYVGPLTSDERDRYFSEGQAAARLYGATGAPRSRADWNALYEQMKPLFERSDIIFEFLSIMRAAPALPGPVRLTQGTLIRAAIDLVPAEVRDILGLDASYGLRPFEKLLVRRMGKRADRWPLPSSPAAQACVRMGRPADYLYRRQ